MQHLWSELLLARSFLQAFLFGVFVLSSSSVYIIGLCLAFILHFRFVLRAESDLRHSHQLEVQLLRDE